ncbi:MAG: ATP-binding protein [Escherichia coli]|nr:ATP-binding protein [Escherichia coli]
MLNEQTLNQLRALRLDGMVAALSDAATHLTASELPFEQRLALLVQREVDWRDSKRLERLLKAARLKVSSACLEDIDWRASRGLSREVITSLAGGDWLRHGHNVLLTGATGCGKTWLACALGQQAARGTRSTLITSQLPVTAWHAWLDEPTLADAILDRIVHGSHKIALKGESMRKLTKAV